MIINYGSKRRCEFPDPSIVKRTLGNDIAVVKELDTEFCYYLMSDMKYWSQISNDNQYINLYIDEINKLSISSNNKKDDYAEWIMGLDDFENGWGNRDYPHCSKCRRGVYKHDAGKFCPFCGTPIKNPITL